MAEPNKETVYFDEDRQLYFSVDPRLHYPVLPEAFCVLEILYPPGMYMEVNVTEAKDVPDHCLRGAEILGILDVSPNSEVNDTEFNNSLPSDFAISTFEKLELSGLFSFLYKEGSSRHLVSTSGRGLADGWWEIPLRTVIEICHSYPPLKGAKLSFQFLERAGIYYLKDIKIPLTADGSPAKRTSPALSFKIPKGASVFFMNL